MKTGIVAGYARTALMFIVFSFILAAIGGLVGGLFGSFSLGLIVMLALSVVLELYALFSSKRSALRAYKVRIITREECPRLYDIVKDLADRSGLPMPEVGIAPQGYPNAFATGRNPQNAAVVATQGILDMLPDDELRAVFAHEMSHIKHRDILVMSVASTMSSILMFLSRCAGFYLMVEGRNDRENGLALFLIGLALQIFVPFGALMIQLGISRSREYMADEEGAYMIRDPLALADALHHIETGCARSRPTKNEDKAFTDMMICNPLAARGKGRSIFSTHPSTEDRIARLTALDEKMRKEGLI